MKNQTDKKWPELFLYSKTDFYLPWKYLENEVCSVSCHCIEYMRLFMRLLISFATITERAEILSTLLV